MMQKILRWMTWEDIRDITTAVHEMPQGKATTAEEYYRAILRHLRQEKNVLPPVDERYPGVLACAEITCGSPLTDTRDAGNTLIRSFVAYRLHGEGFSFSEIGRMMRRDHSTVAHLVYRMRDMLSLPNAYKQEVRLYEEFDGLCK